MNDTKALAEQARTEADQHPAGSLARRGAACVGVVLSTCRSVRTARTALAEHLTGDVLTAALQVLDRLAEDQEQARPTGRRGD